MLEAALRRLESKIDAVLRLLVVLSRQGRAIMSALDDLKTEVAQTTSVEESAIKLIDGLAAQLAAAIASGDPTQLTALQQSLSTERAALAAAVAANTPAAPPAPPTP